MQLLKIAIVNQLCLGNLLFEVRILSGYDVDVFRYVDQHGAKALYKELEEEYKKAEAFLPTRFREYENQSRSDYYKVKNNFYFLFHLAEAVKKEFYTHVGTLRVALSSEEVKESAARWIMADKWRMSLRTEKGLEVVKEFPAVYFIIYDTELPLKTEIYQVIQKFVEDMYEEYSIIKLTGQSCKIEIFRDSLKEFVPGKAIRFKRRSGDMTRDFELKMTCVDGAFQYLKDKRYGFVDISIHTEEAALPYQITAFTHNEEEVELIQPLKRNSSSGMISRNMENLTLKLYLKDINGKEWYQYTSYTSPENFEKKEYEEIRELYGDHIPQVDTDDIIEQEVKFFVYSGWEAGQKQPWTIVPLMRPCGLLSKK